MSPDRIRDALSAHRAVIDRIAEDMVGEIERLITVVLDTLGSGGTLFFWLVHALYGFRCGALAAVCSS